MAALQCDICGGSLTMTEGGEFAVCDSCEMKHDKRRVQQKAQEIRGSVKIDGPVSVEGVHNADNLAENAETFFSIGELTKARKVLTQLIDEYPSDYRGWWGLAQMFSFDKVVSDAVQNKIDIENMNMPDVFHKAIRFAPEDKKDMIKNFYDSVLAKYKKEILEKRSLELSNREKQLDEINRQYSDEKEGIIRQIHEYERKLTVSRIGRTIAVGFIIFFIYKFITLFMWRMNSGMIGVLELIGWPILTLVVGGCLFMDGKHNEIKRHLECKKSELNTCDKKHKYLLNNLDEQMKKYK